MSKDEAREFFKKKAGITLSSARSRLLRKIIFELLKEGNHHFCYRCGEEMTLEDYSIEHIVPWAHEEDCFELYMDTQNIAFSHLGCNSSHSRRHTERMVAMYAKRKKANLRVTDLKKGTRFCSRCGEEKSLKEFSPKKSDNVAGKKYACKVCCAKAEKERRKTKKLTQSKNKQ